MAYVTHYTANFTNELEQEVVCLIQRKDGATQTPFNLPVVSMKIADSSDEQNAYACIISKTLELVLWADVASPITWETFLTDDYDTWKITVTVDGYTYFIGFISPDEGGAPFQDQPYEVIITATDGLGLLKGYNLTKIDGSKFSDIHKVIDYLVSALHKTNLDLPIRAYCTYGSTDNPSKYDSMTNDFFNQSYLNWRTFLKSVDEYENCYDVLKKILGGWCNIQQYQGRWQIMCLSDRQRVPSTLYYVDYNATGVVLSGNIETEGPANVGRYELIYPIYPINDNQRISSRFAVRESKASFKYSIPDDLVLNQKLSRLGSTYSYPLNVTDPTTGEVIGSKQSYLLPDWTAYNGQILPQYKLNSNITPLVVVVKDLAGVEIQRYINIGPDANAQNSLLKTFIQHNNNDFYVDEGDYINVSITYKTSEEFTGNISWVYLSTLAILKDGKSGASQYDWYTLQNSHTTEDKYIWINGPGTAFIDFRSTDVTTQWKTISIDNLLIPTSGKLYLFLGTGQINDLNSVCYKDIRIEYLPIYRGSKYSIKGDYHLVGVNKNTPDVYDYDFAISDSLKRSIKGTILRLDTTGVYKAYSQDSFYTFPATGTLYKLKKLINLGHFNHTYRRMYRIEGEFTSLMYNTATDQELRKPISFHKLYRFTDMNPQRDFVLIPNLDMDLVTGNIQATFLEVKGAAGDGTQTGDYDKYEFTYN